MTATDLLERLAQHKTLGSAPREELAWLIAHGTLRVLNPGDVVSSKGAQVETMAIVLSGSIAIHVDRGAGRHKVMEWRAGDVTGMLPYSRLVGPPGDTVAQEPTEVLSIPRGDLGQMIRDCHTVTSILVHKMLDRARVFTSSGLHDEKMASLGRLAAGLAHELNNPAAAIERSAALLEDRLLDAEESTRALGAARLSDEQLQAVDAVRVACLAKPSQGVLSPIQQAEREDSIADWLSDHGLDPAIAEQLAETAVSLEALDGITGLVPAQHLGAVLRWTASECSVRAIAAEIQEAAMRISGLVMAVKGFTHMDQATVAEAVDVTAGIGATVTVLRAKARSKSASVEVKVQPALPRVRGFAGELNQIWANLLDNAIDAAPTGGRIEIDARVERGRVVIRVIDNGAGVPDHIRSQIFEPFVTSKPVGKGTGLGLDIVRRLIVHNEGGIEFDSVPGRTEFRVSLPLADGETVAQS